MRIPVNSSILEHAVISEKKVLRRQAKALAKKQKSQEVRAAQLVTLEGETMALNPSTPASYPSEKGLMVLHPTDKGIISLNPSDLGIDVTNLSLEHLNDVTGEVCLTERSMTSIENVEEVPLNVPSVHAVPVNIGNMLSNITNESVLQDSTPTYGQAFVPLSQAYVPVSQPFNVPTNQSFNSSSDQFVSTTGTETYVKDSFSVQQSFGPPPRVSFFEGVGVSNQKESFPSMGVSNPPGVGVSNPALGGYLQQSAQDPEQASQIGQSEYM